MKFIWKTESYKGVKAAATQIMYLYPNDLLIFYHSTIIVNTLGSKLRV